MLMETLFLVEAVTCRLQYELISGSHHAETKSEKSYQFFKLQLPDDQVK